MLKVGIFTGILGVFSEYFFFQDYWIPPLIFKIGKFGGLEDFLFGFVAGGIGTAIYDVVFHKRLRKKNNPHYWIIPLILFSEFLSMLIFSNHINSIYASAIGYILPAIIIVATRRDLFIETVFSALIVGGMLVFFESILLFFAPNYLPDYFLLHGKVNLIGLAPITELIWGMAFGALIGTFYEFDLGEEIINLPKRRSRRYRHR